MILQAKELIDLSALWNKSKSGKVGYYCPHCHGHNIQRFSLGGCWTHYNSKDHDERFKRGQDSYRCLDCGNYGSWRDRIKLTLQKGYVLHNYPLPVNN